MSQKSPECQLSSQLVESTNRSWVMGNQRDNSCHLRHFFYLKIKIQHWNFSVGFKIRLRLVSCWLRGCMIFKIGFQFIRGWTEVCWNYNDQNFYDCELNGKPLLIIPGKETSKISNVGSWGLSYNASESALFCTNVDVLEPLASTIADSASRTSLRGSPPPVFFWESFIFEAFLLE